MRNDHAFYALGLAQRRLKALGLSDDQIFALDKPDDSLPEAQKLVFNLARKLTTDPALVADDDVLPLRKHFSDHQVAELIHDITVAAFLDRVTEAAGVPLDR